IAAIAWRRACPGGEVNGLCLAPPKPTSSSRSKARSKIRRCAEPTTPLPRPRTRALAEAAQARLAEIGKLARRSRIRIPEEDRRRIAEFEDAVAQSRLAALDRDLEIFLAMTMPTGLRFAVDPRAPEDVQKKQRGVREASMRRFHEYLAQKEALGRKLMQGYDELRAEKRSLPAMLAAPQRVGLLYESFADQLR